MLLLDSSNHAMWSKALFFFFPVVCFISTATAIPAARAQFPNKRDDQAGSYMLYGVVVSTAPITSTTPPVTSPETSYSNGQDLIKDIVAQLEPISGTPFGGDNFLEIVPTTPIIPQISTSSSLSSSITSTISQPSGASFSSTNTPSTRSSSRSWNATAQQPNQSSIPTPTPSASGSLSSSSNGNNSSTSKSSNSSNSYNSGSNQNNTNNANSSNSSSSYNTGNNQNITNSSNRFNGYKSTSSSNSSSSSNTTLSASSSASPLPSVFVAPVPSSNSSDSNPTSTSATETGSSTSSSTMNTASASSPAPAISAPVSTPPSLSTSSIAGIAVGCTAAFALLVTALGYIFRRRYYANLARKQQTYPKLAYLYDPPGQPPSTHSTARLRPSGEGGAIASGGFENSRYMGYESPRIPSLPPPTPTMARVGEGPRGLGIETESTPFEGFNSPPPPPPGFIHDVEGQQPHRHDMQQSFPEQSHRSPDMGLSETTPFIATAPAPVPARRSTSPTLAGNSGSSSVKMEQREGTWWF